MATAFRFLYKNICCGLCCICCLKPTEGELQSVAIRYRKHDGSKKKGGLHGSTEDDQAASCSLTAGSDNSDYDEDDDGMMEGGGSLETGIDP